MVNAVSSILENIQISISHTTRKKRANEQEGVDYYFIDEKTFIDLKQQNKFLEHALVFNHHYGTSRAWVEKQIEKNIDLLLEIDWQGARHIKQHFPNSINIFILPPSLDTLRKRLNKRDQDSDVIIQARMARATEEMSHYHEYDYLIINDDFETAKTELQAIILSQRLKQSYQIFRHHALLDTLVKS